MKKNPLEIGSWIAGIISAVIALYLLFPTAGTKEKSPLDSNQQIEKAQIMKKEPEEPRSDTMGSMVNQKPCRSENEIREMFKLAGTLSTYNKRDIAYQKIIAECLCSSSFELASKAASYLSTYEKRDESYSAIIDAAIMNRDIQTATELSSKLSTYDKRDAAKNKILGLRR